MNCFVLDAKGHWFPAIAEAMSAIGGSASRIRTWTGGQGYGFVRPSPLPDKLREHQAVYRSMAVDLKMVQDSDHIEHYEDKSIQFGLYSKWMPNTWRFTRLDHTLGLLKNTSFPLVSKANEGSSSRNVRILHNLDEAVKHAKLIFSDGIKVDLGHGTCTQRNYILLQEFIPHTITYRVNAIGSGRAIFFRYCYKDKPLAQTGNVEPCDELNDEMESLLEWSDRFFEDAKTKWCAIDVLKYGNTWKLLESTLAWPWPSPGRCNEGPIFRTRHRWIGMFNVMAEDIACGFFG